MTPMTKKQAMERIEWANELDVARCAHIKRLDEKLWEQEGLIKAANVRIAELERILAKVLEDRTLLYQIKELARAGLEGK